jgi:hypothetical protein
MASRWSARPKWKASKTSKKPKPIKSVLTLRYYEALAKVADGQATKIIIPSEMANVASVATSIAEVVKEKK